MAAIPPRTQGRVCVCVCVCVRARARVSVCVCGRLALLTRTWPPAILPGASLPGVFGQTRREARPDLQSDKRAFEKACSKYLKAKEADRRDAEAVVRKSKQVQQIRDHSEP